MIAKTKTKSKKRKTTTTTTKNKRAERKTTTTTMQWTLARMCLPRDAAAAVFVVVFVAGSMSGNDVGGEWEHLLATERTAVSRKTRRETLTSKLLLFE